MQHYPPENSFDLAVAVDPRPLTAAATTSVEEVVHIMAEARKSCVLPGLELSLNTVLKTQARGSSIWITNPEDRLIGQFTESDALQALAAGSVDGRAIATVMSAPTAPKTLASPSPSSLAALTDTLEYFRQHQVRHLPVVDDQGRLQGVVNPEGIRSALQLDELLKSVPVADILLSDWPTADLSASVLSLLEGMVAHQKDSIVIVAADGTLVGSVAASDVLQLWRLGADLRQLQAESIMESPLLQLAPDCAALEAYWTMQQQQTQRFAVVDDGGTWLGLVTPTTHLYTLSMEPIRQTATELQQSIVAFSRAETSELNQALTSSSDRLNQVESSRLLSTMALHIRESLDLDTILQTAVEEVRQFLECDRVLIYRFNSDFSGTVVVESVAPGWRPALDSTIKDTCFGQNYAQAYKEGRTQVVDDIYRADLSQCHIDILVLFDVRASLVVPILQGDYLWGLLCAYHCTGPRHWKDFEVDLLKQLATHMAIAIQQSQLYRQLHNELCDRERAEADLRASLKEKESLLKEIHHRVKNNLQIISSVLRLQSDYIQDDKVLALFKDSQQRIRSMALIHEKLYKSRDLTRIAMGDYIEDLTTSLLSAHRSVAYSVALSVNADKVWLNIDTAIPCGLIINELVSNALKHAFKGDHDAESEIQIDLRRQDSNCYCLSVTDNGIGFPSELDFRNTESLGLELVCVFTEQLGGEIELDDTEGTRFTVTFTELDGVEGGA